MSRIAFALAGLLLLGLALSSQSFAAQVAARREAGVSLPFELPSLHISGTLIAAAGRRLYIVTIALGDEPIETEPRRFVLLASGAAYEPIGAGATADSIIPFDRIPDNKEVGIILPSDAILALTRRSATNLMLEVGARETVAFLYEVPAAASARALKLPDGRELVIR